MATPSSFARAGKNRDRIISRKSATSVVKIDAVVQAVVSRPRETLKLAIFQIASESTEMMLAGLIRCLPLTGYLQKKT